MPIGIDRDEQRIAPGKGEIISEQADTRHGLGISGIERVRREYRELMKLLEKLMGVAEGSL